MGRERGAVNVRCAIKLTSRRGKQLLEPGDVLGGRGARAEPSAGGRGEEASAGCSPQRSRSPHEAIPPPRVWDAHTCKASGTLGQRASTRPAQVRREVAKVHLC